MQQAALMVGKAMEKLDLKRRIDVLETPFSFPMKQKFP